MKYFLIAKSLRWVGLGQVKNSSVGLDLVQQFWVGLGFKKATDVQLWVDSWLAQSMVGLDCVGFSRQQSWLGPTTACFYGKSEM